MSYAYNFMGRYCNGRFLVVGAVGKTARLIRVHWQPVKTYCQSVLHHTWLCVINMDFALSWRAAPKQQARWREQMFGAIENFGRVDCNFSIKFREIKRFIFYELQSLYGECLFFLRIYQGHSSLEILEPYLVLFGFVSVCVCARLVWRRQKIQQNMTYEMNKVNKTTYRTAQAKKCCCEICWAINFWPYEFSSAESSKANKMKTNWCTRIVYVCAYFS